MSNPLTEAVEAYDYLLHMQGHMMFAVKGDAAFEPFDEELESDTYELISKASDATTHLSRRAAQARMNLIWKDFLKSKKPVPISNDKT